MRRAGLVLTALLLAGFAAACSDDDEDDDAQPYIDALSEELQTASGDVAMAEDDADCVAETSVEALGADFLEENGITPDDLASVDGPQELDIEISEGQARGAAEAFTDCDISFGEAFAGPEGSAEAADCVDDNLDDDRLVEAYTAQYLGDDGEADSIFTELLTAVQEACGELLGS